MKMQKTIFVILFIALVSAFMMGQSSKAKITGKVVTVDGDPMPGVIVTATSPKLVGKTVSISDENGVYRLMNLNPGTYKLTYELEGFTTMVKPNIVLKMEQTLRVPIIMKLKKLEEKIVVTGSVPLIDVRSASQGMDIGKDVFDKLPKGRDFTSLVTAIPGVQQENMAGGISVDGASGSENAFYIDGVSVTDIVHGGQKQNASFDFIEEVQVKASGYMAEYGGSLGGVISAVTRSGGNEFHGSVVGYFAGSALQGTPRERLDIDKEDATKGKYYDYETLYGDRSWTTFEPGLSLGGYLLKDRVWFFGSFLPKFTKEKNHVEYVNSDVVKDHERTRTNMNYMFKITAQILQNVRWSASYLNNYYQYRGFMGSATAWGPYGNPDQDFVNHGFDFPNYSASTSLDITIGNNAMLNIRGGLFFSNQENNLSEMPTTPGYRFIAGSNQGYDDVPEHLKHPARWIGPGYGESQEIVSFIAEKKNIGADFTLYFNFAGEHSLKIGGEFVRQGEDVDSAHQQPFVLFYWGVQPSIYGVDYEMGKYGYMRVVGNDATGKYGRKYRAYSNRYNLYIQDSWTIGEKFTLNFGVRAESEYIPSYSPNPEFADVIPIKFNLGDKLAPRLGFVYDVKGDSTFKIFGSFGYFFDVMKLEMANGSYGGFNYKSAYYPINDPVFTNYTLGNFPEEDRYLINDHRVPTFESTDSDLKPMSQQNISFGFENKLKDDLSLSVRFVNKHLRYAIEDVGVLFPDGEHYFTTNPGYGYSRQIQNGGKAPNDLPETPKARREYYAVNISLEKRFSNNWMGGFSYTWSRLTGSYPGLANSDELIGDQGRDDPNVSRAYDLWFMAFDKDLNEIDGVLATDRTHVIKAYGSYVFPFGLTIGSVANIMSGTPLTETWSAYTMEYFPFNRGNLGRTPMLYNVDFYAEYSMKLGKVNLLFGIDIKNIFNFKISRQQWVQKHQGDLSINYTDMLNGYEYPANTTPHPLFGMAYNYTPPISATLNVKLSF